MLFQLFNSFNFSKVYDGWSTSGKIYLNESGAIKPNVYSLRKRARIEIDVSNLQKDEVFSWRVSSVSSFPFQRKIQKTIFLS